MKHLPGEIKLLSHSGFFSLIKSGPVPGWKTRISGEYLNARQTQASTSYLFFCFSF